MTSPARHIECAPSSQTIGDSHIVDALDAGVIAVAPDGSIVRANRGAARILGMPLDAIRSHRVDDILAPLSKILGSGQEGRGLDKRNELALSRPDGTKTTIGFSVSTFTEGSTTFYVLLFRDVTPVIELRRQRDRLLQMAALGDVLPSVLHELRNPLAAVTSMLEVMVEETEGNLQNDLHAMLWELRRINLNLQGVGGISRPIGGSHTAIDHAIRESCRILENTATNRRVTIVCHVDDMPLIPLDRSVVNGILFNLVSNAIDACRKGGKVEVTARLPKPSEFELVVRDDGRGMNADTLAHCCELFFTNKDGGSGIGLALCKEAATGAGGTLDIESKPGFGTTVTVRIPLHTDP